MLRFSEKLTIASGVTVLTSGTVSGSGTTNVNQTLSGGGRQWWYLSSPLGNVSSSIFGADKVGKYIENYGTGKTAPYYSQPFTTPENLEVGRGYIVKRTSTDEATYTFTGGSLNSGNLTITPTRTGTTAGKRGFNLIGNPYPSYINWDDVYVNEAGSAVNMRNAIWFRTYNSELTSDSKMEFHTYSDGEGVPDVATKQIAPMQAFWVRVDADNTPASLTFKNTHRSHMEATGYNPLKAKSADLRPRVRLVISNGEADDEMLLVGKSYAANGLDSYDIEKLSNDNAAIPELYSLVENQELVINSMQELNAGKWVMLGMRPGEAGSFNITASQLDNIDVMVVLKDRLLNVEKELTLGETYSFTSDGIASNDRFSLEFRAPGTVTSVNNLVSDAQIFINENRQLTVQAPGITLNDRISIYNMAGQKLLTQQANGPVTVLAEPLSIGVYIVKVNELVQKVIVK